MAVDHKLPQVTSSRAWKDLWHLWTVLIPRRSIAGRLVFGRSGGVTMDVGGSTRSSLSMTPWTALDDWLHKNFGEEKIDEKFALLGQMPAVLRGNSSPKWSRSNVDCKSSVERSGEVSPALADRCSRSTSLGSDFG